MGEIETQKEVRERARRDAQNKAVEKAVGTFIKSHAVVSNYQIAEDLVYAAVRGKITKEEIITSDWDAKERNLYRIRIKALVEPVYPEKGEGLSAKLSLSQPELHEGEEVKIFYQVSEDYYAYIFSIAADGSVTLLFPNSNMPDNFTKAGRDSNSLQQIAVFILKPCSCQILKKTLPKRKSRLSPPATKKGFSRSMMQNQQE